MEFRDPNTGAAPRDPEQTITRRDLPAVVKRAAELAAVADDASEELSEQEVIRIAAELGLPERHVRQALYEGTRHEEPATFFDRHFPPPRISTGRAVPIAPDRARRMLEDYFITHEYLQKVRRQASITTFEPAADPVSKLARTFQRSSRHQLARAELMELSVRPLEPEWSHVRIRAVYKDQRRSKVTGVVVGSVLLGIPGGAGLGALAGAMLGSLAGPEGGIAAGVLVGLSGFAAITAGLFSSAKARYRRWRARASTEAESLLDRVEKGDELRPPPPPWMRKLQIRFGSF